MVSNIFIFIPTWGIFPIWLIFFRWVDTTNQRKADINLKFKKHGTSLIFTWTMNETLVFGKSRIILHSYTGIIWDHDKPLQGSIINNQDSMESKFFFFSRLTSCFLNWFWWRVFSPFDAGTWDVLLHHLDYDESSGLHCGEIFVRHISTTSGWRSMKWLKPNIYNKVIWMEKMLFNSFVTFQKYH